MASGRILAIVLLVAAVLLGLVTAVWPGLALLAAIVGGLLSLVTLVMRDVRQAALIPIALALLAPWQRITALDSNLVLYPAVWAAGVALLLIVMGGCARELKPDRVIGIGLAFVSWAALGHLFGHGTTGGILRLAWLWGFALVVYALLRNDAANQALRRSVSPFSLILGFYAVVEWILKTNWLFGTAIPTYIETVMRTPDAYRSSATLGHPLVLGDVLGALVLLQFIDLMTGKRLRSWDVAAMIFGMFGLVVSGARGVMVLLIGCIALAVLLVRVEMDKWIRRSLTVVAVIALVTLLATPLLSTRFSGVLESASLGQRLVSIEVASAVVGESPLFGAGPGMAADSIGARGYAVTVPESEYASLPMNTGVPGLLLVCSLPVVALLRSRAKGGGWYGLPIAAYALGVIGTHNFFDWWSGPLMYVALCAVIVGSPTSTSARASVPALRGATWRIHR